MSYESKWISTSGFVTRSIKRSARFPIGRTKKNWSICQTNIHRNGNRRISNNNDRADYRYISPIHLYDWCHQYPFDQQTFSSIFPFPPLFSQTFQHFLDRTHKGIQLSGKRDGDFSIRSFQKKKKKKEGNEEQFILNSKKRERKEGGKKQRYPSSTGKLIAWLSLTLSLSLSICFNELNTRGGRTNDTGIVRKIGSSGWPGALRFVPKLRRYICTAMNNQ